MSDVSGNRVYLADGALRIFDVTNPGNPVKLGEYISPTGNGIQNIAVQGNYLYLGDGSYGTHRLRFYAGHFRLLTGRWG